VALTPLVRWTDISNKTPLPEFIQLINRRLGKGVPASRFLCEIVIGDGVTDITPGIYGDVNWPKFPGIFDGWILTALQTGNLEVDLWLASYDNFPPTIADSIVGTLPPTLTAAAKNKAESVKEWNRGGRVFAGDILRVNVTVASGIKQATLALSGAKV
jgi:hypothetical protein